MPVSDKELSRRRRHTTGETPSATGLYSPKSIGLHNTRRVRKKAILPPLQHNLSREPLAIQMYAPVDSMDTQDNAVKFSVSPPVLHRRRISLPSRVPLPSVGKSSTGRVFDSAFSRSVSQIKERAKLRLLEETPSGTRRKSSFAGVNATMSPTNPGKSHLPPKSDDESSDSTEKQILPEVESGPPTSEEWEHKRNIQATHIDATRCETSDVIKTGDGESLNHAALRLRTLIGDLKTGNDVTPDVMASNLQYAVSVMEYWFLKNMSGNDCAPSDDDMPANLSGATPVPPEIKRWLLQTFSSSSNPTETVRKKEGDKRSLRSVVHAVQAGMFVERIFRKHSESSQTLPPVVQIHLQDIDKWSFDVFELENISDGNSLKYIFFQLLSKYDLIRKYKIPIKSLMNYSNKLQQGYRKHNNKYHNPIHAADVAQSLNCLLMNSGFQHWLSDLEVFSMIMGAIVHDLEHTGTTNNFHTNTRSELALMYNDRSVLENHHISTAFRLLGEEDCNILVNFSKEDYQECRTLMIDMVLATDMSQHFGQIKRMKSTLQHPETLEKSKAMCLMIHSCDINHPSKPWNLHYRWTERLVVEFFEQGDKERELGLPLSPLCDRHSTMVAQSQIGFIDYVIEPTFGLLFDILKTVNGPIVRDVIKASRKAKSDDPNQRRPSLVPDDALKRRFSDVSSYCTALNRNSEILNKLNDFHQMFLKNIGTNRGQWKKKDEIERANLLFGERAFTDPKVVNSDNTDSEVVINGIATKKEIEKMNISSERTLDISNNTENT